MENIYGISSKILHRTRVALKQAEHSWNRYVDIKMSRDYAKHFRKYIISINGKSVVGRKCLGDIKAYSRETFGDSSYWPWLACYTELRGEFKEGWIPEDYYRFELLPKFNPVKFQKFSEAKTIDHKLFNGSIIEPLMFRMNNRFYDRDGYSLTKSDAQNILSDLNDEIIIKPDDGRGGHAILFKHSSEIKVDELSTNSDLLFQKVVSQHPELNRLYPHSINTFRVLSYLNEDGEVEIKFTIIRFGMGGARIDNASNGGGWMFIHQNGMAEPTGFDKYGLSMGTRHPDTGTQYADLDLSFFPRIIAFCKKNHRNFPYTKIIGWDVFLNKDGEAKLIEWNANNPFWSSIEARFGPFFLDPVPPLSR